jgi:uncharacterized protein YeeX (DUF496 family)
MVTVIYFVNAYRGIIQKDLQDNEKMILDNHHLVYFQTKNISDFVDYLGIEKTSDSDYDT